MVCLRELFVVRYFYYPLVALAISFLAVAQFRVGVGELDLPLIVFVVFFIILIRVFGVGKAFFVSTALWRALEFALFSFLIMALLYGFDFLRTEGDPRVLQSLIKLVFGIVFFVFFAHLDLDRNRFSLFLALFSSLVVGFYIFNSYVVLGSPYLVNNLEEVTKAGRNQIALYLSAVTVFFFYQALISKEAVLLKFFLWTAFGVHAIALVYCSSRSAWVSVAIALVPAFIILRHRTILPSFVVLVVTSAVVPALLSGDASQGADMLESLAGRALSIFSGEDPTGEGSIALREELIAHAVSDFFGSPLYGIGAEQFLKRHDYVTHNSYLQFLVENGVLGLVVFVVPFFLVMRGALILTRSSVSFCMIDARLALVMSAVTFSVNIAFVNVLGAPIFFVVLGLAFSQMRFRGIV